MSYTDHSVEFGFGIFLVLSLLIHLGGLGLFSLINMPEIPDLVEKMEKVVPVSVSTPEPVKRRSRDYSSDWLDPGISISGENMSLAPLTKEEAALTRLPESFRWAPAPPEAERINPGSVVPRPQLDREKVSAPVPEVEPPSYEDKVKEDIMSRVADLRLPDYPKVEGQQSKDDLLSPGDKILADENKQPEPGDDLLSPGEEQSSARRRQLQRRPSFPYADVQEILPDEKIAASFDLTVASGGEVTAVEVIQSSGIPELDSKLSRWIKNWAYQPAEQEDVFGVRIEIPAK